MRKMAPFYLILPVIVLIASCGNEPPEREKSKGEAIRKYDEVMPQMDTTITEREKLAKDAMAIHDEIMPQMDAIIELSIALREVQEKLEQDSVSHSQELARVREALALLDKADAGMMDWMHRMGQAELDNYTDEEAVAFLEAEKHKIIEVQELMKRSIDTASSLLIELEPYHVKQDE